ncbi:MAG: cupin domain-containing protein [Candidatus Promineifilaceae bacterium]
MKTFKLHEDVIFNDSNPNAEPLHVDQYGRILRFALQPGQTVQEHNAPNSPVNIVVLQGHGLFAGGDGQAQKIGPDTMILFDPGENHTIKALEEPLVFLAILHEAPNPDRKGD